MAPVYRFVLVAHLAGCVAGCGTTTRNTPPSHSAPSGQPVTIPDNWDELTTLAEAVYVGAWSADDHGGCLSVQEVLHPPGTPPPQPLCAVGETFQAEVEAGSNVHAFVARSADGEAQIEVVAAERSALLERVRCERIERFWASVPGAHMACDADAECEVLSAMCFSVAVVSAHADPYRSVAGRFGGPCLGPDEGACPPESYQARCVSGQCRAVPE